MEMGPSMEGFLFPFFTTVWVRQKIFHANLGPVGSNPKNPSSLEHRKSKSEPPKDRSLQEKVFEVLGFSKEEVQTLDDLDGWLGLGVVGKRDDFFWGNGGVFFREKIVCECEHKEEI